MANGSIDLTPTPTMVPAYRDAYNATIRQIESDLRHGRVPDFDGEIARLQQDVLHGGPDASGRMAAYSDYRSIVMGSVDGPVSGHPRVSFTATSGASATVGGNSYPTLNITLNVVDGKRTRTTELSGAIDASRLSEADRDRLSADRAHYMERRIRVIDRSAGGTGAYREVTVFLPITRHPVTDARRPLLARRP